MKTSYRHLVQIALGTCTAASKENLSRRSCAQFSTEIFAEETCRIIPGISSSGDHLQWTPCFHYKGRSSPASLQPLMILVFFHLPFRILTMQTGWNWNSWWFSGCPFFSFIIEVQEFSIFGMELFDDYVRDWALAQRWLWRQHQISCCIEAGDLAQDPTPKAQWVIGIHPEVTKGGPWFRCWAVRC